MRKGKRGAALTAFLLAALLCLGTAVSASAATATTEGGTRTEGTSVVTLTTAQGTLDVTARRIDGYLFVPLAAFASQFTEVTYRYDAASGYATLTAAGLTLRAGVGGSFLTANDRCLYGVAVNRLIDGTVWVPLNPLAKAMSLGVSYQSGAASAGITGSYRALTPASSFYREDEVYWLSRIISAESRGESLRGQMAVGNVVLNRVRSGDFPNTIYSVIFQGGQFSPVSNGTIYQSPAWTSVCAAKMCLEGYSITNDALFFCNLSASTSSWVVNNRPYAFVLGAHTFFL